MAQQTAVEWLEEQFLRERFVYDFDFDKAKEMEKQQIEAAWQAGDGEHDRVAHELSKKYYNQKYKTENHDI